MTSPLVGELQQTLLELGYPIAEAELAAVRYGPDTMRAVMAVQRTRGLVVDGIAGDLTFAALRAPSQEDFTSKGWCYDLSALPPHLLLGINAAINDIGTLEEPPGSNAGPGLVKYRGHTPGQPWCAYWLSWALEHNPGGCPWGVLGSVLGILRWAQNQNRVVLNTAPVLAGDVWLKMRTMTRGHVALIVDAGDVLSTVEGNSGNAVRGRLRLRGDATAIVRPYFGFAAPIVA